VLCSLSACSGAAGAALDTAVPVLAPPRSIEARVAPAVPDAQQLPQPHRTPKLSQAPPLAM
jgi:hypothetical protein